MDKDLAGVRVVPLPLSPAQVGEIVATLVSSR